MWTHFWDMHSGGGQKLAWPHIFIEAPMEEAIQVFFHRFSRNARHVTCRTCGSDYSITEGVSLAQITGFHRGCRNLVTPRDERGLYHTPDDPAFKEHYYLEDGEDPPAGYDVRANRCLMGDYIPLEEFVKRDDVCVIYAKDITPAERVHVIDPEDDYYDDDWDEDDEFEAS